MILDRGNVVVEFAAIVVAAMLPVAYLGSACWDVARTQLALRTAAHAASRAYVLSGTLQTAQRRAASVVAVSLADAGVSAAGVRRIVSCSQSPCLTPGGYVTVRLAASVRVAVPVAGSVAVSISAADTSVVDVHR